MLVLGEPDGITDEFVYEFKSTRNRFLMREIRPIAFTQANLYGYFFRRAKKRVQIYVREEERVETWENEVNVGGAQKVLKRFKEIKRVERLRPKPNVWKCRACKYKEFCRITR
ncbi:MAG: hypothetical protein QXO16_07490 [Archaeoglobaceae archaeon]